MLTDDKVITTRGEAAPPLLFLDAELQLLLVSDLDDPTLAGASRLGQLHSTQWFTEDSRRSSTIQIVIVGNKGVHKTGITKVLPMSYPGVM